MLRRNPKRERGEHLLNVWQRDDASLTRRVPFDTCFGDRRHAENLRRSTESDSCRAGSLFRFRNARHNTGDPVTETVPVVANWQTIGSRIVLSTNQIRHEPIR